MCYFDVDPCEVYKTKHRKARKQHACTVCHGHITKGNLYKYHSWISDGYPGDAKVCNECEKTMDEFRDHHGQFPSPDWFAEALRECFDGAPKQDLTARKWRSAYAGILKRNRAAKRAQVQ